MFNKRSEDKELLDADQIDVLDLQSNLDELEFINKYLGGHKISLSGLRYILKKRKLKDRPHIADIGCGGGDSLRAFEKWATLSQVDIKLSGVDLKQDCINYCKQFKNVRSEIQYFRNDFRAWLEQNNDVDIVHAALFCHHLNENEILDLIDFCRQKNVVLLINDLERHPIAYYSIKMLTKLFSGSRLVKNDAPLSVLRGFKKREWMELIRKSGAEKFNIFNKWAFRHLIIIYPSSNAI